MVELWAGGKQIGLATRIIDARNPGQTKLKTCLHVLRLLRNNDSPAVVVGDKFIALDMATPVEDEFKKGDQVTWKIPESHWAVLGVKALPLASKILLDRPCKVYTPPQNGGPWLEARAPLRCIGPFQLTYEASTLPGSSGGPIIQDGAVVGTHRGALVGGKKDVNIGTSVEWMLPSFQRNAIALTKNNEVVLVESSENGHANRTYNWAENPHQGEHEAREDDRIEMLAGEWRMRLDRSGMNIGATIELEREVFANRPSIGRWADVEEDEEWDTATKYRGRVMDEAFPMATSQGEDLPGSQQASSVNKDLHSCIWKPVQVRTVSTNTSRDVKAAATETDRQPKRNAQTETVRTTTHTATEMPQVKAKERDTQTPVKPAMAEANVGPDRPYLSPSDATKPPSSLASKPESQSSQPEPEKLSLNLENGGGPQGTPPQKSDPSSSRAASTSSERNRRKKSKSGSSGEVSPLTQIAQPPAGSQTWKAADLSPAEHAILRSLRSDPSLVLVSPGRLTGAPTTNSGKVLATAQ